jgi:hypothetical protein
VNSERLAAQQHGSRNSAGGEAGKRDHAVVVMLLLIAMLAPTGAAADASIGTASSPEYADTQDNSFAVMPSGAQAQVYRHQPLDEEGLDEQPEPFIADDVRTEGRMYAATGITTSIASASFAPSRSTC